MYRLFQRIPKGLDPVAELFRKHVESEGMQRVKEATETAAAKKEKDAGARHLAFEQLSRLAAVYVEILHARSATAPCKRCAVLCGHGQGHQSLHLPGLRHSRLA